MQVTWPADGFMKNGPSSTLLYGWKKTLSSQGGRFKVNHRSSRFHAVIAAEATDVPSHGAYTEFLGRHLRAMLLDSVEKRWPERFLMRKLADHGLTRSSRAAARLRDDPEFFCGSVRPRTKA